MWRWLHFVGTDNLFLDKNDLLGDQGFLIMLVPFFIY